MCLSKTTLTANCFVSTCRQDKGTESNASEDVAHLVQDGNPRFKYTFICISYTVAFLLLHLTPAFVGEYRSGTVNSNTVNSKFHLIQSFSEIFATFLLFHL